MRVHKREARVNTTQSKLILALLDILDEAELTEGEFIRVVVGAFHEVLGEWAKHKIREERHGNTDKPGGIE